MDSPNGGGGGGFLSNRRIKLTAVFPMIVGTRRTISKSDSSSLAKTGKADKSAVAGAAAACANAVERPPLALSRNRMRRGSSLTDLNRSDSLAGTVNRDPPRRPRDAHSCCAILIKTRASISPCRDFWPFFYKKMFVAIPKYQFARSAVYSDRGFFRIHVYVYTVRVQSRNQPLSENTRTTVMDVRVLRTLNECYTSP